MKTCLHSEQFVASFVSSFIRQFMAGISELEASLNDKMSQTEVLFDRFFDALKSDVFQIKQLFPNNNNRNSAK